MKSKEEVLAMIDRANHIYIGVNGPSDCCYFPIPREVARERADVIAGYDLLIEFGNSSSIADHLYIESAVR